MPPGATARSWKLWELDAPPRLAVEVVGDDVDEDYAYGPIAYPTIGVAELIVYDQEHSRRGPRPMAGLPAVSEVLGCWLRVVPDEDGHPLVRLATGPSGDELLPTAEEAERAAKEEELALRGALEAEVEALRPRVGDRGSER